MPTGRRKTTPYVRKRIAERERAALEETCRCGRQILVGLDGDVAAVTVRVEPVPVSAADELLARAVGISAYRARSRGEFVELEGPRDRFQVAGSPADPVGDLFPVLVHLRHRCPGATS